MFFFSFMNSAILCLNIWSVYFRVELRDKITPKCWKSLGDNAVVNVYTHPTKLKIHLCSFFFLYFMYLFKYA